jgi:hypothetical protein
MGLGAKNPETSGKHAARSAQTVECIPSPLYDVASPLFHNAFA